MRTFALGILFALTLAGCQVTPDKPREGIAACYYTVRVAFNTAADLKARAALPAEQEKKVVTLGDQALAACDAARLAINAGDTTTAQGKLQVAEAILLQLESWITAQGVKP